MRIVTWNIGGGFISQNGENIYNFENVDYFLEELKKINPDIICFQEIHNSKNNNQAEIISKALNLDYKVIENVSNSHLKENEELSISIISKFPILKSQFHKLPNPNLKSVWNGKNVYSHDKGFMEININYKNNDIKVFSGHILPFRIFGKDLLDDEFKNIRDSIENSLKYQNIPEIICADMNFNEIEKLIPNIFKQGFKSILPDLQTTPDGNKYDKIIISSDINLLNSEIIIGKADHYLCYADLEFNF